MSNYVRGVNGFSCGLEIIFILVEAWNLEKVGAVLVLFCNS